MNPYAGGNALPGTLTTQDAGLHRQLKKPVVHMFSTSNMISYESFVNSNMAFFFSRLDELYTQGEICDFGTWLEWFVSDVLGELTFSKCYGYLDNCKDIHNVIQDIKQHFDRVSLVGIKSRIPTVDSQRD